MVYRYEANVEEIGQYEYFMCNKAFHIEECRRNHMMRKISFDIAYDECLDRLFHEKVNRGYSDYEAYNDACVEAHDIVRRDEAHQRYFEDTLSSQYLMDSNFV